jgi:hypothetical protein
MCESEKNLVVEGILGETEEIFLRKKSDFVLCIQAKSEAFFGSPQKIKHSINLKQNDLTIFKPMLLKNNPQNTVLILVFTNQKKQPHFQHKKTFQFLKKQIKKQFLR